MLTSVISGGLMNQVGDIQSQSANRNSDVMSEHEVKSNLIGNIYVE